MIIKDAYPIKAQFGKDEPIELKIEFDSSKIYDNLLLSCIITNLNNRIFEVEKAVKPYITDLSISFPLDCFPESMKGYNVSITLLSGNTVLETVSTAFDRTRAWKDAPRYGFLSEFGKQDMLDDSDIIQMNKYHLNIIQFYDWMYRHYQLFPPEANFSNPFGRNLSIDTVRKKIESVHKYGMKAFGYGAVYGAQKEYFEKNKDLGLYQNDGAPANLGNFLINMDISSESEWHDHIINEFSNAISFGFDGIHMDQYGQPKEALSKVNGREKVRKLKNDFFNLINDTKKQLAKNGQAAQLIFNAVNNWPIESVANSDEDAVYIEVWPPNDTYNDLYMLVTDVKKYCKNKQVILAAYLGPFLEGHHTKIQFAENATLLTMAAIFASGGFHLLLGENNGILKEAYYVNYVHLTNAAFITSLRKYYDFITAYEELLYDYEICDNTMTYTGGINDEYCFKAENFCNSQKEDVVFLPKAKENCIWTVIKEKPGFKIIHLLNYVGIDSINWNEEKQALPETIDNIEVTALIVETVKDVYFTSPDFNNCMSVKLDFEYVTHPAGRAVKFIVPKLKIWDMIYITVW
jgi:dextranase